MKSSQQSGKAETQNDMMGQGSSWSETTPFEMLTLTNSDELSPLTKSVARCFHEFLVRKGEEEA